MKEPRDYERRDMYEDTLDKRLRRHKRRYEKSKNRRHNSMPAHHSSMHGHHYSMPSYKEGYYVRGNEERRGDLGAIRYDDIKSNREVGSDYKGFGELVESEDLKHQIKSLIRYEILKGMTTSKGENKEKEKPKNKILGSSTVLVSSSNTGTSSNSSSPRKIYPKKATLNPNQLSNTDACNTQLTLLLFIDFLRHYNLNFTLSLLFYEANLPKENPLFSQFIPKRVIYKLIEEHENQISSNNYKSENHHSKHHHTNKTWVEQLMSQLPGFQLRETLSLEKRKQDVLNNMSLKQSSEKSESNGNLEMIKLKESSLKCVQMLKKAESQIRDVKSAVDKMKGMMNALNKINKFDRDRSLESDKSVHKSYGGGKPSICLHHHVPSAQMNCNHSREGRNCQGQGQSVTVGEFANQGRNKNERVRSVGLERNVNYGADRGCCEFPLMTDKLGHCCNCADERSNNHSRIFRAEGCLGTENNINHNENVKSGTSMGVDPFSVQTAVIGGPIETGQRNVYRNEADCNEYNNVKAIYQNQNNRERAGAPNISAMPYHHYYSENSRPHDNPYLIPNLHSTQQTHHYITPGQYSSRSYMPQHRSSMQSGVYVADSNYQGNNQMDPRHMPSGVYHSSHTVPRISDEFPQMQDSNFYPEKVNGQNHYNIQGNREARYSAPSNINVIQAGIHPHSAPISHGPAGVHPITSRLHTPSGGMHEATGDLNQHSVAPHPSPFHGAASNSPYEASVNSAQRKTAIPHNHYRSEIIRLPLFENARQAEKAGLQSNLSENEAKKHRHHTYELTNDDYRSIIKTSPPWVYNNNLPEEGIPLRANSTSKPFYDSMISSQAKQIKQLKTTLLNIIKTNCDTTKAKSSTDSTQSLNSPSSS